MMKRLMTSAIIFLFLIQNAAFAQTDYSVGMSPTSLYLGEIDRGSSKTGSFRLITPSTETLRVQLESYDASIETVRVKFSEQVQNLSEERSSDWLIFVSNPVDIEPMPEEKRSWKDINFFVNVPSNSEPGYHVISVRPSISMPEEAGGQVSSLVVGVTTFSVSFYVKGEIKREGIILDVVSGYKPDGVELGTYFQNTGTVTINARAIQYIEGKGPFQSAYEKVAPGKTAILKTFIPATYFSRAGEHNIETLVDYTSGSASINSSIAIDNAVVERIKHEPEAGLPFIWILLMLIAISILFTILYIRRF